MEKDNVIPNKILEQKRKDSTIEFRSVAKIFDEFLRAEGVIIPKDSDEEEGSRPKFRSRKRVYIPDDSDEKEGGQ